MKIANVAMFNESFLSRSFAMKKKPTGYDIAMYINNHDKFNEKVSNQPATHEMLTQD